MKIKRYTADSMRAALAQVRAEQGPDAVILSSRRGEEGIEVIAAVDYDEGLFAAATRQRAAEPAAAIAPAVLAAAAIPAIATAARASMPAPRPVRAPAAPVTPAVAAARPMAAAAVRAGVSAKTAPASSAPAPVAARPDPAYGAVQQELKDMRQLLETS